MTSEFKPGDILRSGNYIIIVMTRLEDVDSTSTYYVHDSTEDMPVVTIAPSGKIYTNHNTTNLYDEDKTIEIVGHFDPLELHKLCTQ